MIVFAGRRDQTHQTKQAPATKPSFQRRSPRILCSIHSAGRTGADVLSIGGFECEFSVPALATFSGCQVDLRVNLYLGAGRRGEEDIGDLVLMGVLRRRSLDCPRLIRRGLNGQCRKSTPLPEDPLMTRD
jgi:hypothetical protein